MDSKKGQVSSQNALPIILIIGLAFLIMATIAFIGDKYGDALRDDDVSVTLANETLTTVAETGEYLSYYDLNDVTCSVLEVTNATDGAAIPSTNYTATNCFIAINAGHQTSFNNTNWNVTYTAVFDRDTVATNVTSSLNTEISSNTSIIGIVLTISLVGIVLTVLIGVFAGVRARRI